MFIINDIFYMLLPLSVHVLRYLHPRANLTQNLALPAFHINLNFASFQIRFSLFCLRVDLFASLSSSWQGYPEAGCIFMGTHGDVKGLTFGAGHDLINYVYLYCGIYRGNYGSFLGFNCSAV